jgi:hypothetical protein
MSIACTTLAALLISWNQANDKEAFKLLVGNWKVDLLDTRLPSNATVEEHERASKSLKEAGATLKSDGKLVMVLDGRREGRWRVEKSKVIFSFKGASDIVWKLRREQKQLVYDFKAGRGPIRFVLKKVG